MQTTKRKLIKGLLIMVIIGALVEFCDHVHTFNKDDHQHTELLGGHLFKEKFQTFRGGVLMNNDYSYYLTDSVTFRKYVGKCDENELYKCIVAGDTIRVIKYSRAIIYGKEIPIGSIYFSIKALKEEGDFD